MEILIYLDGRNEISKIEQRLIVIVRHFTLQINFLIQPFFYGNLFRKVTSSAENKIMNVFR